MSHSTKMRPETPMLTEWWLANPDGNHDDAVEAAVEAGFGRTGRTKLRKRSQSVKAALSRPVNPDSDKPVSRLTIARRNITRAKNNGHGEHPVTETTGSETPSEGTPETATQLLEKAEDAVATAKVAKTAAPFEAAGHMHRAMELLSAANVRMEVALIDA